MSEGKTIGNVNVLDIRKTTEEAFSAIKRIGNVNIVLYSPATAPYIGRLNCGNINSSIEIPADAELQTTMGSLRLAPGSMKEADENAFHVVMGSMTVESGPDRSSMSDILGGVGGLVVMGSVLCPESLSGALRAKVKQLMGGFATYPDDAILVTGSLELSTGFLDGLEKPAGLVVTGSVKVMEDVSEQLERKIDYLQVQGSIICTEENADAVRSKLRAGRGGLTVVPSEHRYHEGDLWLDTTTLESLTGERLFCTGTVVFGPDVESSAVDRGIAGLRSLGLIVCPKRLKDAVKSKVDMIADRVIFYEGELWLFDDEHALRASRFEYLDGKATALVTGELRIEPEVAPSVLADRFHVVHNLGEIRCTPEQMGAIEARLGIHDGELLDSTPKVEGPLDIANVNVLAL
jgi:hypothetical protein